MIPLLMVVGAPRSAASELAQVLSQLPVGFRAPVAAVLHREVEDGLVDLLSQACALPVVEPDDKEELRPARVLLAPGGYHLLVDGSSVCLSLEPSERGERPSIDALFESAADAYGARVAALLLPGHEDGWWGLERVRARGGSTAVLAAGAGASQLEGAGDAPRIGLDRVGRWLTGLGGNLEEGLGT